MRWMAVTRRATVENHRRKALEPSRGIMKGEDYRSMPGELEAKIRETGLNLYRLIEGETPSIFKKDFWAGKIMEWCMRNEAFKIEMFRFVDAFPSLTRSESVARHLQEYFCRPDQDFPSSLQWGLKLVSPTSLVAKMVSKTITANITGMAKQFIVGPKTPATPFQR